jgi:7,8-dihydropterin-6-yl-methyl-4-(beta-D-ribofuranosyl)aminobenzene 5'-phosphate synthase
LIIIKDSKEMKTSKFLSILLVVLFLHTHVLGQDFKFLKDSSGLNGISTINGIENPVTIKVVYDNYAHVDGLKADWGYSIVIEGLEKHILFDAGANPTIFESNFKKMDIDAEKIDYLILSHEHGDHTAGIPAFIKLKKDIPVIIPYSFSESFKKKMVEFGLEPLLVKEPVKICTNLYSSGEFSGPIPEQALVLNTKQGLVVMTGCSHPGIVEMLKEIKSKFNKNIYAVFGGFHLLDKSDSEMKKIITDMQALGIVKCGATHCTGVRQTEMIKEAFGTNFIELGVGNNIIFN